jgi:hypothetical protein
VAVEDSNQHAPLNSDMSISRCMGMKLGWSTL